MRGGVGGKENTKSHVHVPLFKKLYLFWTAILKPASFPHSHVPNQATCNHLKLSFKTFKLNNRSKTFFQIGVGTTIGNRIHCCWHWGHPSLLHSSTYQPAVGVAFKVSLFSGWIKPAVPLNHFMFYAGHCAFLLGAVERRTKNNCDTEFQ